MKVNTSNMKNVQAFNYYKNIEKKEKVTQKNILQDDKSNIYENDVKPNVYNQNTKIKQKSEYENAYGEYYKDFYNISVSYARNLLLQEKTKDKKPKGSVIEEVSSRFAKIENNIIKNFNGSEKEKRLRALTDSYANAVKDNIAHPFANSFWYAQGGTLLNSSTMTSEKELFIRGVSTADTQQIFKNIQSISLNAKGYYEQGNKKPVTEIEKNAFNEYVSGNYDGSIGNWSYNQILTALDIAQKDNANYTDNELESLGFALDSIDYLKIISK